MNDRMLIEALVKCIDELMPGIGHVVYDIGHLNDTLIAARRRLEMPLEGPWCIEESMLSKNGHPRFTIRSNEDDFSFDVHTLVDGSMRKEEYPDGWIVRPGQVKPLAYRMVRALNLGWDEAAEVPHETT